MPGPGVHNVSYSTIRSAGLTLKRTAPGATHAMLNTEKEDPTRVPHWSAQVKQSRLYARRPTKKERGGNQKPETKHPNTPKGGPQQGQPNNLGQLNPPAASSPFHLSSPPWSAKVFKAARKEEASACNSKDHKIQVNPKLQRSEPINLSSLHSSAREGGKKHGRFALLHKLHESSEMRLRVENGIIW